LPDKIIELPASVKLLALLNASFLLIGGAVPPLTGDFDRLFKTEVNVGLLILPYCGEAFCLALLSVYITLFYAELIFKSYL